MESAKSIMEPVAWLLQMLTGILMVFLVTAHFILTHMTSHESLSYSNVVERVSQPEFKLFYAVLLLAVSFHAFNGLRAIILDTDAGMKRRAVITVSSMLGFILAFAYGIFLLFSI